MILEMRPPVCQGPASIATDKSQAGSSTSAHFCTSGDVRRRERAHDDRPPSQQPAGFGRQMRRSLRSAAAGSCGVRQSEVGPRRHRFLRSTSPRVSRWAILRGARLRPGKQNAEQRKEMRTP